MALSNHERVGKALELLNGGLRPFVERELQAAYGKDWVAQAGLLEPRVQPPRKSKEPRLDVHALLGVMWDQWNDVFKKTLGQAERTLVSELRDVRNKWAHQEAFSTDDAYRALDSIQRLLNAVSAPESAEVDRQKQEILRVRFDEQARQEKRRSATASVEGQPAGGLRPWREIVTPHPDVASGRYQQAEFAADLGQVHRGEGSDEYRHPTEFFRRTFLTEGLKQLLVNALVRLSGKGGDPVVELQTNFGGGKTHSMLALYHLFSGVAPNELPGIEPVLRESGVTRPPQAHRAVLVGTKISPGQPIKRPDGTTVRTLWGELAKAQDRRTAPNRVCWNKASPGIGPRSPMGWRSCQPEATCFLFRQVSLPAAAEGFPRTSRIRPRRPPVAHLAAGLFRLCGRLGRRPETVPRPASW